jgi:hypothetical protein
MSADTSIKASRDLATGQLYVPPRPFAADGSLRECQPIDIPARGVLLAHTSFRGTNYGLIDLDSGPRIQAVLAAGATPTTGSRYRGTRTGSGQLEFTNE